MGNDASGRFIGMEYPGRFIVLGQTSEGILTAVYGITGRSPPSRARELVVDALHPTTTTLRVNPTDPEAFKTAKFPDLLTYDAVIVNPNGLAVSNGRQTNQVSANLISESSKMALYLGHRDFSFEPDEPNFTPRISGCISAKDGTASVGIIRRVLEDGRPITHKHYFDVPLKPGQGTFISTYSGENKNPLPSFQGEPFQVPLLSDNPWEETAKFFYDAFAPQPGKDDLRVAVAAVFFNDGRSGHHIINRHDLEKRL